MEARALATRQVAFVFAGSRPAQVANLLHSPGHLDIHLVRRLVTDSAEAMLQPHELSLQSRCMSMITNAVF